ncbi:MAG TPA: peptidylprolyl isomerase [Roseateles sp.]|nr:peptidylprolyl isomerase [Roseateles sp.]
MNSIKNMCATSALVLLAACGGGGGSDGGSVGIPPAVPPVTMTITHKVAMTTSMGVIELGLDANHAPVTVANFLKYTNDGFYKNTVFHRVVSNFVIQGGGFVRSNGVLTEKPATYAPIALESNNGLSNVRGTIAMARTSVPNSATSQFYINVVDNTALNYPGADNGGGYAVFGKVTAGLDVVDAIKAVATDAGSVPVQDVTITEVKEVK